jgi:hypothetical protein
MTPSQEGNKLAAEVNSGQKIPITSDTITDL